MSWTAGYRFSLPRASARASFHLALAAAGLAAVLLLVDAACAQVSMRGALAVWHPLALTFTGPQATEIDEQPNPFLDYRLLVNFTGPDGCGFDVPGYFAGDGAGGAAGNHWRVHFSPPLPGPWEYRVSFRSGPQVAVQLDRQAGRPVLPDGVTGRFTVAPLNPEAEGFLAWGRLGYVGQRYLKFRDGPYWIKGGADSPENLLAYAGFDDTKPSHHFQAHVADWRQGDPDWGSGKGRGLIGALNYLAARRVNSIYFLTMNVGGDGQDVWPWTGPLDPRGSSANDNLHFDISKLDQWNTVFEHAQRKGIFLHFVFNEAEAANKRELDDGELGVERKLYYREFLARFAHHLALEWNICEEYNIGMNLGVDRVQRFAAYIRSVDAYDHPLTVHSAGDPVEALRFTFTDPNFDMTSVQLNQRRIDLVTESLREATSKAGRALPLSLDEFTVDKGQKRSWEPKDDARLHRMQKLWPTYLSGGMIEFILEDLLDTDSFKTPEREKLWDYTWFARKFVEPLPFWEMEPNDSLSRGAATINVGTGGGESSPLGAQVLHLPGRVYAVYLPHGSPSGEIDLRAARSPLRQQWYNPRTGEFEGTVNDLPGGDWTALGEPPRDPEEDWAVLLQVAPDNGASPELEQPTSDPRQTAQPDHPVSAPSLFPQQQWQSRRPEQLGLDGNKLEQLAEMLGGRGCVVKNGLVVKSWGSQSQKGDWLSAAKPVLSTLLMFAIEEGKVQSPDQLLSDFGWRLRSKDQEMTFRHLANMSSGYARPEKPGEAWSYNDFAIQLYQKTLFERVYPGDPDATANAPTRFGALQLEDGLSFRPSSRRLSASVRDFARIAWLWLNRGRWGDQQLLPSGYFEQYMRPQTPRDLPHTRQAETDDYLQIGSYGGGSDHFTRFGPGVYGFNWWFNAPGREHPDRITWPDAPRDVVMAIGFGGNCAALLPSQGAILVAAQADWGKIEAGQSQSRMNQVLQRFAEAVRSE